MGGFGGNFGTNFAGIIAVSPNVISKTKKIVKILCIRNNTQKDLCVQRIVSADLCVRKSIKKDLCV